jgi:hypothetical protein
VAELSVAEKVVENRLREKARRWNLRLVRTRKRDSPISGSYGLVDDVTEEWAFAGELGFGKSLQEVEGYLHQVANGQQDRRLA